MEERRRIYANAQITMTTKKTSTITATLTLLGKTYSSKGKTVQEVLTKLNPPVAKGTGILVLEKGKLKRDKILGGRVVNNIFGERSPIFKELAMKNITSLFSDFD